MFLSSEFIANLEKFTERVLELTDYQSNGLSIAEHLGNQNHEMQMNGAHRLD